MINNNAILAERERTIFDADQAGFRLEWVGDLGTWEASPVLRHQKQIDNIRRTIHPQDGATDCACVHYADVLVKFPDGSQKRPDISLFCREPDEETSAVTLLPEAVIEVLSRGYETKDLEIGVPFYRRSGVKDIIVLDPDTNIILHFQNGQPARELVSPVEITLLCGCQCTI